jgi:hypothetical protein
MKAVLLEKGDIKTENFGQESERDFYAKQIIYKGEREEAIDAITRIAMLVGKGMIRKYRLNEELTDSIESYQYMVASNIHSRNNDFFAKALYHKSDKNKPVGVMFGNYIPDLNIAVSSLIYVESERDTENKLEGKLVSNFVYWAKNIKKANKVFIEKVIEV